MRDERFRGFAILVFFVSFTIVFAISVHKVIYDATASSGFENLVTVLFPDFSFITNCKGLSSGVLNSYFVTPLSSTGHNLAFRILLYWGDNALSAITAA